MEPSSRATQLKEATFLKMGIVEKIPKYVQRHIKKKVKKKVTETPVSDVDQTV